MTDTQATTKPPTGGAAFPNDYGGGMSLRDWFAGQAMGGFIANPCCDDMSSLSLADLAYGQADAMLAVRATGAV